MFSANAHGSILLVANTLMTCEYSVECQAARATTSAGDDNDDFVSRFVDSDGDTST